LIKALWANSPFYDFNLSLVEKKFDIPMLSRVGKYLPKVKFPSKLNKWYTTSLHKQLKGEWDFNLDWKPTSAPTVQL
ncbi:alpha/beta hydrolase, partial [Acinetobacter baumannii]